MRSVFDSRGLWMVVGLAAGLCMARFWPAEPLLADATDRDDKFAMLTVGNGLDGTESIFVLDFLTGRLEGAALNPTVGAFTQFFGRNIAADFRVDPTATPHYAIVSGQGNLPSKGATTFASGVIYVGELSSGRVMCYAFPYRVVNRKLPKVPLLPVDGFQFREPVGFN